MRSVLLIFAATLSAVVALPQLSHTEQWNLFKSDHGKVYDPEEETHRFQIFAENLKKIEEHNALYDAGEKTYYLGVTKFADMTDEEFSASLSYTPVPVDKDTKVFTMPEDADIPDSLDYREKNAVTPIKDQKKCDATWAFSVTGALETRNFLKTGKLVSLSEQNLIDCSIFAGNDGCWGGNMRRAYDYVQRYGIGTEEKYPFVAEDQHCTFNQSDRVVNISDYTVMRKGNETELKAVIALHGPVSTGVDSHDWKLYKGGIYKSDRDIAFLSIGIVTIGYGSEKGVDYWIARNSWGETWGEGGYIRILRNQKNQAGITDDASYPNLI